MHRAAWHELNTAPDDLRRRVDAGETVLLTDNGVPIAELRPVEKPVNGRRPWGSAAGEIKVADDFDAPLPDDILRDFEG